MQKLGRANRSRTLDGGSVFIWLPEAKVRGPRWSDLDAAEQDRLRNPKRKPKARLPGELERIHVSELVSDASAVTTVRQKATKPKLRKNAPPELWRQEVLSDDEYKLYNPGDRCLWGIMLNFFDQKLLDSDGQPIKCNNCNSCRPGGFTLSPLRPEDHERSETEEGKQKVKAALAQLAERLSKQPVQSYSYLLRLSSTPNVNQFLTSDDRKRFTDRYFTVASGDLMGWPWKKKYGVDVIQTVCKAIGCDPPSIIEPASHGRLASLPTSSPHSAPSLSVSTSIAPTDSLASSQSTPEPLPQPTQSVLRDITNAMTARGCPAVNKSKRKKLDT
jgi:hypothetical protein